MRSSKKQPKEYIDYHYVVEFTMRKKQTTITRTIDIKISIEKNYTVDDKFIYEAMVLKLKKTFKYFKQIKSITNYGAIIRE